MKHYNAPIQYYPNYLDENKVSGLHFINYFLSLDWEERTNARREKYFATQYIPYTYGTGEYARTYMPEPMDENVKYIGHKICEQLLNLPDFELCFLNYYENEKQALGWHSDDGEIMDHTRPIVVVSFGAEREIWTKPIGAGPEKIEKILLGNGSVFVMEAGMQYTHVHKIPKHSAPCGPRVSLTYRGLKP